ncbi:DUF4189 domain-containing protein [Novosphingobium sp.]|uniref:DUF4189 domain-containing protein n=1 Tax=Novosphingobium sp. TaxID=1874826 RepID=UPI0025E308E5|nr:DUF4189 domain-containing protein [Novosphingobium sp.]MCC6925440.1 DUF4189 domain-containing protein [Novosphingobium sp.]
MRLDLRAIHPCSRAFRLACAVLLAGFAFGMSGVSPALAQCEVEVRDNNGFTTGCLKLKDADPTEAYEPESVDPVWSNSFVAVAFHPEARDFWAVSNVPSREQAESKALGACRKAMGNGCWIERWGYNTSISVARDPRGFFFADGGPDPASADRAVLEKCQTAGWQCDLIDHFTAAPVSHDPREAPPLRQNGRLPGRSPSLAMSFASLAVPKPEDVKRRYFLSSGRPTRERADLDAIALCEAQLKIQCQAIYVIGSGALHQVRTSKGGQFWTGSQRRDEAERQIAKWCADDGVTCHIAAVYPAEDTRNEAIAE